MALLSLFSYDVDPAAPDHDRATIEGELEHELNQPGRQVERPGPTARLIRFQNGDVDSFIDAMNALRKSFSTFSYFAVSWNPAMPGVRTFP